MKKGFTLIELLVVGTIIAVMAAAGVISYTSANRRSRDTRRISDLEQFRNAFEQFRADNGYYPSSSGSWIDASSTSTALYTAIVSGSTQYMPALPKDPSSTKSYYYQSTNFISPNYYGYCICADLDNTPSSSGTCSSLTASCDYGLKNP